jgi:hypothetical protein
MAPELLGAPREGGALTRQSNARKSSNASGSGPITGALASGSER